MNSERKRNITIGAFAIVAIAILCVGLNYLKGRNLFSSGANLTACYASVDGLTDSSPILFHGFKVGTVKDIDIDQFASDPAKVFTVVINIEKNIEVPIDSRAEIVNTDLLGGKGIEIVLGNSTSYLSTGDTILTSIRSSFLDDLGPVKDQASALMSSATGVFSDIDTILDASNRENINQILYNMSKTMRNMELVAYNLAKLTDQTGTVAGTFNSANRLVSDLSAQSNRLDSIMRNVNTFTASLARANVGHAFSELDSVLTSLKGAFSGDGNIGKVMNDTCLYDNLSSTIDNLNRLLVDLRLNPSRYINISAFKIGGRQVYFSDTNTANSFLRGKMFAVRLASAKKPVDFPTSICGTKIYEYCYNGRYAYLIAPFATAEEAEKFVNVNNIKTLYPDAVVEEYQDGEKR